jgi:hypothetical protein
VSATRRQVLAGGLAAATAAVTVGYGRFALGDQFEGHFAGVLGISEEGARGLLAAARLRADDVAEYELRAAAFLAATTFPGEVLMPKGARERAVGSLLALILFESEENLVTIGLRPSLVTEGACSGLLRT